jgi:hypothetical protein
VSISDRRASDQSVTGREWVAAFAERLGVGAPDDATTDALLGLAGVAAHASERIAAPIACYLVGLADADPQQVLDAEDPEG